MKRVILGLVGVVLVGQLWGCGAARQAAARKELNASAAEAQALFTDKNLDPIRGKVPFPFQGSVLSTSVPDTCPTEEEKIAIDLLRRDILMAKEKFIAINDKYGFRDFHVILSMIDSDFVNLAKLHRCELTFMKYAENREISTSEHQQEIVKIKYQAEIERQAQAQQAAAAFGAALQNVGNAIQQQEAIRQANRPRQTICRQVGNSVNCTEF